LKKGAEFAEYFINDQIDFINADFKELIGEKNAKELIFGFETLRDIIAEVGWGEEDGTYSGDSIYEFFNKDGTFAYYIYEFIPKGDRIYVDQVILKTHLRVATPSIILYNYEDSLFGSASTWTETVNIDPTITDGTMKTILGMTLSPIINGQTYSPSSLVEHLKEAALALPDDPNPTESARRSATVGGSSVEITDPDLFCLIPSKWIKSSGKVTINRKNGLKKQWEFSK